MTAQRSGPAAQGFTSVDVDGVLLERARVVLGVRTARRAVELALREVVDRARKDSEDRPRT